MWQVSSARIILVEGILIYADPEVSAACDIKIFVDTEPDLRFIRRLRRDIAERGRSVDDVIRQYQVLSHCHLAITRYSFTSRLLCTNQPSFYSRRLPVLPNLVQYYCTIIGQYTTPLPTSHLYAIHHAI